MGGARTAPEDQRSPARGHMMLFDSQLVATVSVDGHCAYSALLSAMTRWPTRCKRRQNASKREKHAGKRPALVRERALEYPTDDLKRLADRHRSMQTRNQPPCLSWRTAPAEGPLESATGHPARTSGCRP